MLTNKDTGNLTSEESIVFVFINLTVLTTSLCFIDDTNAIFYSWRGKFTFLI